MLDAPVLRADLTVCSRGVVVPVVRVLYAAVLFFVLWLQYGTARFHQPLSIQQVAYAAQQFFVGFSVVQILAIYFLTPALAAGMIATERERRTIEYLFATDLTNREIVFGKVVSRLIQLSCLVLAGVPVLAAGLLLGGVSPALMLAMFAASFAALILLTALSTAISIWSPRARDAVLRAYMAATVLLAGPYLIDLICWSTTVDTTSFDAYLHALDPLYQMVVMFAGQRSAGQIQASLWYAIASQLLCSAALLHYATGWLRRVHLDAMDKRPRLAPRPLPHARPVLGDDAMLWKELYSSSAQIRLGWTGILANTTVLGLIGIVAYNVFAEALKSNMHSSTIYAFCSVVPALGSFTVLMIAVRAAGSVVHEKERDTWDTLLTAPLTGQQIARAKIFGAFYGSRILITLLAALVALLLMVDPWGVLYVAWLTATIATLFFFAASLGLFYSVKQKNALRAISATIATLFFVGLANMFCCAPFFGFGGGEIVLATCIPFLITLPIVAQGAGQLDGQMSELSTYIGAQAVGVVGYAIAGWALFSLAGQIVERRGQTDIRGWRRRLPRFDPERYVAADASTPGDALSDAPQGQ